MANGDLFPNPDSLRDHLERSLFEIDNRMGNFGSQALNRENIQLAATQLQGQENDNWLFNLSHLILQLEDDRDFGGIDGRVGIGGTIEVSSGEYQQYSFSISVFQRGYSSHTDDGEGITNRDLCCSTYHSDRWTIVRRYHFDVDPGATEEKPVCHLQEGGHVPIDDVLGESLHYCKSNIKKPRIPHPPIDLVLAIDFVLCQYPNLTPVRDQDWKGLVKRSESVLWAPYFQHISARYTNSPPNNTTMDFVSTDRIGR